MKNMKLRVVALMLVIPILLIYTTSTVTKTVDILVDVPVKSVAIDDIEQTSIDIAEGKGVEINVTVEPSNASNATVVLSDEATVGKEDNRAEVVVKNGVVYPVTAGNVTIKASAGDKSDTVDLYFYSSKPMNDNVTVKSNVLTLKEGDKLNVDDNLEFQAGKPSDIVYSVDDSSVASVNADYGNMKVLTPGETSVTVGYGGITVDKNGNVTDVTFEHSFKVVSTIDKEKNTNGVTVGSEDVEWFADVKNNVLQSSFYFWYDTSEYSPDDFEIVCDEEVVSGVTLTDEGGGKVKADFTFSESAKSRTGTKISIKRADVTLKEQTVSFEEKVVGEPTAVGLGSDKIVIAEKGSFNSYAFLVDQDGKEIDTDKYYATCKSSDEDVLKIKYSNGGCKVCGVDDGTATVTISLRRKSDGVEIASAEAKIEVVKPFENLKINSDKMSVHVKKSALDGVVTIGRYSYKDGSVAEYNKADDGSIPMDGSLYSTKETGFDSSKVVWSSTNENIAKVENGRLVLGKENGEVTLKVENNRKVGVETYDKVSASLTINVVDGVNVSDESELKATWENGGKAVVLTQDISLATDVKKLLDDEKYDDAVKAANAYLKSMETTGEASFYVNNGNGDGAKVKYLFEITTDLYGNGYSIDADALTRQIEIKTGKPLFGGPLNLVSFGENGGQNASVKAQDNIVFLVEKDGIKIRNVELKGCSDESILKNDSVDLTLLDYAGTVLEIVGDDCGVEYSRINNGRTVVRIYGKANPKTNVNVDSGNIENYRVNAAINNSILSYGREFILKIGTNFTKKTVFDSYGITYLSQGNYTPSNSPKLYDDASPYLTKNDGTNYETDNRSENLADNYFYDNYVLTDVTVENCVFRNAGLFSVGLDSMFGGLCLHGFDYNDNYLFGKSTTYKDPVTGKSGIGWQGVAGTSYPAVLRLKGDVRFYDWKQVDSVNSDTLIEGDPSLLKTIGLNMNVSQLIKQYAEADNKKNSSILSTHEVSKLMYVNGAIALYGGGKNYSIVDTSEVNENFERLHTYSVPVENFNTDKPVLINYTAGAEPFVFYLYDDSSKKLSIVEQEKAISDGSWYDWIVRQQ